jgi:hypothetical protein
MAQMGAGATPFKGSVTLAAKPLSHMPRRKFPRTALRFTWAMSDRQPACEKYFHAKCNRQGGFPVWTEYGGFRPAFLFTSPDVRLLVSGGLGGTMDTRSFAIAALAVVMPFYAQASERTPTSSFCLAVDNAVYPNPRFISVEVDGYSGYWVLEPNQTKVLVASQADDPQTALRGETFTVRIYEGSQGSGGALLDTTTIAGDGNVGSPHTISTPVGPADTDARTAPECRATGEWMVLVHG